MKWFFGFFGLWFLGCAVAELMGKTSPPLVVALLYVIAAVVSLRIAAKELLK